MIKTIKNFINWSLETFFKLPEKIRFLMMGGFNTVVGYIMFVAFYFLLKNFLHYQIILFLSYLPTTFCSFLTFKFFVFRTNGKWTLEYLRVVMSSGVVYLTNIVCLYFLVEVFGDYFRSLLMPIITYNKNLIEVYVRKEYKDTYILLAQLVSISVMTVVSYLMNKYFSFQVHLKRDEL